MGTKKKKMPQARLDKAKYMGAVLYFVKYCNNAFLGATKLNKLLYYLDFISYRDMEKPVTGDIYIHKDFGPVPENIDVILSELKTENFISAEIIPYMDGFKQKFEALKAPDLASFSEYEKNLLHDICKTFELWETEKIVAQTHLEAPWFYSQPYETVDYAYSKDIDLFVKDGPVM